MGFTREGVLRPYEAGLRPLREPPFCRQLGLSEGLEPATHIWIICYGHADTSFTSGCCPERPAE
jgi:hypothetical protein